MRACRLAGVSIGLRAARAELNARIEARMEARVKPRMMLAQMDFGDRWSVVAIEDLFMVAAAADEESEEEEGDPAAEEARVEGLEGVARIGCEGEVRAACRERRCAREDCRIIQSEVERPRRAL